MTGVFLDANVIISACVSSRGESRTLFRLSGKREDVTLLVTPLVMDEVGERLYAEKTPHTYAELEKLRPELNFRLEPSIVDLARVKAYLSTTGKKSLPKNDLTILAGAVSAGASMFLTRDRNHFGHLYEEIVFGVKVLKPKAGLTQLEPRPRRGKR